MGAAFHALALQKARSSPWGGGGMNEEMLHKAGCNGTKDGCCFTNTDSMANVPAIPPWSLVSQVSSLRIGTPSMFRPPQRAVVQDL